VRPAISLPEEEKELEEEEANDDEDDNDKERVTFEDFAADLPAAFALARVGVTVTFGGGIPLFLFLEAGPSLEEGMLDGRA